MARYSTFKYSDAKYGTAPTTTNLLWSVEIDWANKGYWDGTNEARYTVDYGCSRGRRYYLAKNGAGFGSLEVGRLTLTLVNKDGRFDPYNTSSPLYPNVEPGKYIRIRVKNGTTGETYDRFAGIITDIRDVGNQDIPMVAITAEDGWSWLQEQEVSIIPQADTVSNDAIDTILTEAEYPSIWGTDVQTGATSLSYWWEDGRSASACIADIADSELAHYGIDGSGKFIFLSRYSLDDPVVTITQSEILKDLSVSQPWEFVRNVAKVTVKPITLHEGVEIWRMTDKPSVAAGATLDLWGNLTYESRKVAALAIDQPIASTDFTMNTVEDGSGSDVTGDFTVTAVNFGERVKVSITNGGAGVGYITELRLLGDALDNPSNSVIEVDDSTAGQQKRVFSLESKHIQRVNSADSLAKYLADFLGNVRGFPTVRIENRPEYQFAADLTDRISLSINYKGIAATIYRIGYVEERWLTSNGQSVLTTWITEPSADLSGYWIFNSALQFDVTTIFGL